MKKPLVKSLLFISALLATAGAGARTMDGRYAYFPGFSAASLGRGATGVSDGGMHSFHLNPASIAGAERLELFIGYGSVAGDYGNTGIAAAFPTSYGALGISFNSITTEAPEGALGAARILSIGGAKEFTDRLSIGAAFDMLYGTAGNDTARYAGAALGARYTPGISLALGGGFGIFQIGRAHV